MTLDEACELAQWNGLASAPEYLRALLVVQSTILDRLEASAPPVEVATVAPASVVAPVAPLPESKPKRGK